MSAFSYFTGTGQELTDYWYTYQVQTEFEVVFIGFGRLNEIVSLKSISNMPSFKNDEKYTVIIHQGYSNRIEAVNNSIRLIREIGHGMLPLFNKEIGFNKGKSIICNETGVVYASAYRACQALNIQPPRMSNHLRGLKGHKTIHGLTFKYVNKI